MVSAALLLPLLGAIAWSATRTYREREADLREQASVVVATAAAYLNQRFDNLDSLAVVLGRYPAIRTLNAEASHRLLGALLSRYPFLLDIVVTDPTGRLRGSGLAPPPGGAPPFEGACLQQVLRTDRSCASDYMVDASTRRPIIVLAYPIPGDDGRPVGVLNFALNLLSLQNAFAAIPLPSGSVITLTDRTSRVLVRSRDALEYVGVRIDPHHALAPGRVPPIRVMRGLDGTEEIFGNAVIARGPWLLSVGIPKSLAVARVWPLWRRNFRIAVGAVLASLIFALFLARGLSRPLSALTTAAQRIAGGDLSPPAPMVAPNRELAQLRDAFGTMATNLAEARAALDAQIAQERRAREEVELLQDQVVRQERLAAVGLLVSGVAHELNNPLQAILGATELMQQQARVALPPPVLDEIAFIQKEGARARDIIRNLSRFARQETSPTADVRLADVVAAVLQLRERDLTRAAIRYQVDIRSDRPVVAGFTELQQVVLNFVVNAEQAIAEAGRPDGLVAIDIHDVDHRVRLEVADNGNGVPETHEPKLFQPFFTTKPAGYGTGLGLSVSYGIIDSCGGAIGYARNEWGGATFYFELPARSAGTEAAS